MTANGKAVSHEAALMEYAITKDRAEYITSHGLHANPIMMVNLEASEILAEFRQHRINYERHTRGRPMANSILRFELCPTTGETLGWTRDDHAQLAKEFISILDSLEKAETKKGTFKTPRTTIGDTQWVAVLHHDGDNGCDHIHLLCNRIDRNGKTINDSFLQAKAELAANIINERRGWRQSMEIGIEHREQLKAICMKILQDMPRWDWDDYFNRLEEKGFEHFCRREKESNAPRGYCIFWGNSSIPANEIDRSLTWGKIEDTWLSLHSELQEIQREERSEQEYVRYDFSDVPDFRNKYGGTILTIPKDMDSILHSEITLPDSKEYENEEVDYKAPEIDYIAHVAVALFFSYIDAATTIVKSHGGGGGDTTGRGKDKDDDDIEWMRRCARMASNLCRPRHYPRIKRGGLHI